MDKYKKLFSNSSIMALGAFSSKILVFLLLPIYSSAMGTDEFGVADLVAQAANLLEPVVTIGICNAVFRFAYGNRKKYASVFTTGFSIVTAGLLLFLIFLPLFGLYKPLSGNLMLMFLYVMMYSYHMLCANFLRSKNQVMTYAFKGILCTAVTLLLNILFLVIFKMGVVGYLLANILADFIAVLYMFWSGNILHYINFKRIDIGIAKQMIRFSLPLIPTTIFWWITNISDRFLVQVIIDESATGIYAMSYKIPNLIVMLTGIFIEAWQMSIVEEEKSGKLRSFFTKIFESYKAVLFIVASLIILLVKVICKILMKNNFYEAWRYIPVLVIATVCMGFVTFVATIYMAKKKSVNSLICASLGAFTNIILNLLLIKPMGIQGAAVATFASYFLVYFVTTAISQNYLKYKPHIARTLVNIVALGIQSFITISEFPYWYIYSAVIALFVFVFNLPRVYLTVAKILRK